MRNNNFHILSVKDNGIGLRLNILKEVTEKYGGEVWLEPGFERVVTFYISIRKNLHN